MIDHTKGTHPVLTAKPTFERPTAVAPGILLFVVILLFGIFSLPRHADDWVEVLSDGAASTIPLATDSIVALASALVTAVGVVWLYLARVAR